MKHLQTVLDRLAGTETTQALITVMEEKFQDFSAIRQNYLQAMAALETDLGNTAPSVKKEMEAIHQQTASTLFYSWLLGIQANLNHFKDPTAGSFLAVDPELYLRENAAKQLPEYESAQKVRRRFYSTLTPAQKDRYQAAIEYVSYLDTVGPKLAHYYGYLLGNELLYRVVPGYYPDRVQTLQYRRFLEDYFGIQLG